MSFLDHSENLISANVRQGMNFHQAIYAAGKTIKRSSAMSRLDRIAFEQYEFGLRQTAQERTAGSRETKSAGKQNPQPHPAAG